MFAEKDFSIFAEVQNRYKIDMDILGFGTGYKERRKEGQKADLGGGVGKSIKVEKWSIFSSVTSLWSKAGSDKEGKREEIEGLEKTGGKTALGQGEGSKIDSDSRKRKGLKNQSHKSQKQLNPG